MKQHNVNNISKVATENYKSGNSDSPTVKLKAGKLPGNGYNIKTFYNSKKKKRNKSNNQCFTVMKAWPTVFSNKGNKEKE